MPHNIDHSALPFDEIVESRLFPRDLPAEGQIVSHIMQDGWEILTVWESDWEGAGPVTRRLLALNDLLAACKRLLGTCAANLDDQEPADVEAYQFARAAIAKAEGKP